MPRTHGINCNTFQSHPVCQSDAQAGWIVKSVQKYSRMFLIVVTFLWQCASVRFVPILASGDNSGQKLIWYWKTQETWGERLNQTLLDIVCVSTCMHVVLYFLTCGRDNTVSVDEINGLMLDIILPLWKDRETWQPEWGEVMTSAVQIFTITHTFTRKPDTVYKKMGTSAASRDPRG